MRTPLHLQPDYTAYRGYYQIKLPLEMETMIPADDPVRLLSAFVEGMDLSELYRTYDRIRKNQASPRQMMKIVLYAAMAASLILTTAIIEIPFLAEMFEFVHLDATAYGISIGLAFLVIPIVEIVKAIQRAASKNK